MHVIQNYRTMGKTEMAKHGTVTRLGELVKQWRKDRAITLREAGEELGLAPSTLSDIEQGRRRADIETLLKLSYALQMTLEETARADGRDVTQSPDADAQVRRIQQLVAMHPRFQPVLDALEHFSPNEWDVVLTVVEGALARRAKAHQSSE